MHTCKCKWFEGSKALQNTMDFVPFNVSLSKCHGEIYEEFPSLTVENWALGKCSKCAKRQKIHPYCFIRGPFLSSPKLPNCYILNQIWHKTRQNTKNAAAKEPHSRLKWWFWLAHLHLHVSFVLFATRSRDHLDSTFNKSRFDNR